jgi:hypothetical protein
MHDIYAPPPSAAPQWGDLQHNDGVDEAYLDQFSWGPGCGMYFWSRAMIYFLLGSVVINFLSRVMFPSDAQDAPSGADGLMGLLLLVAIFTMLVYAGKVGRRRRWTMLRWRDFEHYRKDEEQWNLAGAVGWGVLVLAIVGSFFSGLMGALNGGVR